MNEWLRTAAEPTIVRRALACAGVVGFVLITINHGDAILSGQVTGLRICQMGLTAVVPFIVSTYSSVSAVRTQRKSLAR